MASLRPSGKLLERQLWWLLALPSKPQGTLQLCAGQSVGCEAVVLTLHNMFAETNCEGIIMVDASNAFNSLNRAVTLCNIPRLCPVLSPIIINTYRCQAELFVMGRDIHSKEGTTQGDPLAMAFYAIAILQLIKSLMSTAFSQVWFADDVSAAGQVQCLCSWWDLLVEKGPAYGYFPNAVKRG